MKEFWEQSILWYNLPLTILMGAVTLYWILSMIGTVDLDGLDIDFDADADGEFDTEISAGHNVLGSVLKFINAQDVPIMMILSLISLFMWIFAIFSNYYLNPLSSGWLALGLLFGNFIVSTLCVKTITQPLRPFFRALKKDEENSVPLIGSVGTVKSKTIDQDFGQITIQREKGAPALINARLEEGKLERGATVLITSYDEAKKRYLVKSMPELASKQFINQ